MTFKGEKMLQKAHTSGNSMVSFRKGVIGLQGEKKILSVWDMKDFSKLKLSAQPQESL